MSYLNALVAGAGIATPASTRRLEYAVDGVASGTLGSMRFEDEPLTFTAVGYIDPVDVAHDATLPSYSVELQQPRFRFGELSVPLADDTELLFTSVPNGDAAVFVVDTFAGGAYTGNSFSGLVDSAAVDVAAPFADIVVDTDFVAGSDGFATRFGGLSFDELEFSAYAQMEVVFQTAGPDVLRGGNGAEHFDGRGGADLIYGRGGNDVLEGGTGDDRLYGDEGDDQVAGGAGDDYLMGRDGNDELDGGAGDDRLYGDDGDDEIAGGDGDDYLRGGEGDDVLDGGADDDYLRGGEGNDWLVGGAGDDRMRGGDGADRFDLTAAVGADRIYDFTLGEDRLVLEAAVFAQLDDDASGGDGRLDDADSRVDAGCLIFTLDIGGAEIDLYRVDALDAADFDFVA